MGRVGVAAVALVPILLLSFATALVTGERTGLRSDLPAPIDRPVAPLLFQVASFRLTPATLDLGMNVSAAVVVHGAVGWVRYDYSGLPPGCPNVNASAWSCAPATLGGFSVSVVATTSSGASAQAAAALVVHPPLAVASFAATPNSVPQGTLLQVRAIVTGGTPPYDFAYLGLPPGCISVRVGWFNCTPTTNGSFAVRMTVTDAVGSAANATLSLAVTPPGAPLPPPPLLSTDLAIALAGLLAGLNGVLGYLVWDDHRKHRRPPGSPARPDTGASTTK